MNLQVYEYYVSSKRQLRKFKTVAPDQTRADAIVSELAGNSDVSFIILRDVTQVPEAMCPLSGKPVSVCERYMLEEW